MVTGARLMTIRFDKKSIKKNEMCSFPYRRIVIMKFHCLTKLSVSIIKHILMGECNFPQKNALISYKNVTLPWLRT